MLARNLSGNACQAVVQAVEHGGVAIALLRRSNVKRGLRTVLPTGIAADFGFAAIAALEAVYVNSKLRATGFGGLVFQAAGCVELVCQGAGKGLVQRRCPKVFLRESERVLIALVEEAVAVNGRGEHNVHAHALRRIGGGRQPERAIGQLVILGGRGAAARGKQQRDNER